MPTTTTISKTSDADLPPSPFHRSSPKSIPLASTPKAEAWPRFMEIPLVPRHLRKVTDLSPLDIHSLFDLSREVKRYPERYRNALSGQTLAMIFQKPSLRTRVTFETGIFQLGGQAIYLGPQDIQLGKREALRDIAANLSLWVDAIMLRTFEHAHINEMALHSRVPVINGLSDTYHPCQALADIFSLWEHFPSLSGLRLAYVGDGNNVLHSLLLLGAMAGMEITYATPHGYEPSALVLEEARHIAALTHTRILPSHSPKDAVAGAVAVYTDVWASMGQEDEAEKRKKDFASFQVTPDLMHHASPHAFFMHCLPAHRGEEVTADVLDGRSSIVLQQAENRLHVQKALMLLLMRR